MANNLGETSQYGSLAQAIIVFYAKLYGRNESAIVEALVGHFAREDHDLNPQILEGDQTTEDIIAHYAKTYEQNPSQIVSAIVVDFAKNDPDFDLNLFSRQQSDPSILHEMELHQDPNAEPETSEENQRAQCPFIATVDRFENREISDHNRIDGWFSDKVENYRCPAGLGPEGQALRDSLRFTYKRFLRVDEAYTF